ncbi:exodeoxyribonuclease VII small subunit [Streptacidiphilus pinicola]|uniref:Exodeoxyribonuclease 7 small subunit n=1 Tax=Streptacidiphilus pinicola TaxID=2219663 RepID=A0A2X0ILW5_9ACTN|nr:exodeoxyribonuclease VII small subunit [Streptacidiphilus pinicola]RAG84603.1 exodeoxyribonuclease VII small subunit [Streptacidiphilus pinicola]
MAKTEPGAKPGETNGEDVLGYEQAREELLDVVRRLETGGGTLEESLALWERGEELARVCERWLDGARARLDAALAADEGREAAADEESEDE